MLLNLIQSQSASKQNFFFSLGAILKQLRGGEGTNRVKEVFSFGDSIGFCATAYFDRK